MTIQELFQSGREALSRVVVGHEEAVDAVLAALVLESHVLIEGPPGTAKTLMVRALASGHRARLRADPVHARPDAVGPHRHQVIFQPRRAGSSCRKGPVFTQLLLADEINRTPPKTQAALLEAMEERQVTIEGRRSSAAAARSSSCATQNPSSTRAPTRCPKRSSTGSCSSSGDLSRARAGARDPRRHRPGFGPRDLDGDRASAPCSTGRPGRAARGAHRAAARRGARLSSRWSPSCVPRGDSTSLTFGPRRAARPPCCRPRLAWLRRARLRHPRRRASRWPAGAAAPDRAGGRRRAQRTHGRRRGRRRPRGGDRAAMITARGLLPFLISAVADPGRRTAGIRRAGVCDRYRARAGGRRPGLVDRAAHAAGGRAAPPPGRSRSAARTWSACGALAGGAGGEGRDRRRSHSHSLTRAGRASPGARTPRAAGTRPGAGSATARRFRVCRVGARVQGPRGLTFSQRRFDQTAWTGLTWPDVLQLRDERAAAGGPARRRPAGRPQWRSRP